MKYCISSYVAYIEINKYSNTHYLCEGGIEKSVCPPIKRSSGQIFFLAHRIGISEILPWDRKSYLTHAILPRTSSNVICEIAS